MSASPRATWTPLSRCIQKHGEAGWQALSNAEKVAALDKTRNASAVEGADAAGGSTADSDGSHGTFPSETCNQRASPE